MKQVLLYARVSTEEQSRKDLSIPTQIALLREYCKKQDYKILGTYSDDGISAKTINKRKGLLDLLERIKGGDIDIVLFTRLDRFTRSGKDYYILDDLLNKNNCKWDAILEDYDTTTANGQLMLGVKLAVNQNELLRTSERIKDVFNEKVKKGTVLSGSVPLGYKIAKDKTLEIDKEKEEIVRYIFERFAYHKSKRRVAKEVTNLYGDRVYMDIAKVTRILKNTKYYGSFRGNDSFCIPYISKEEYERNQHYLTLRTYTYKVPKKDGHVNLFTGIAVCPVCGKKMRCASRPKDKWGNRYYQYKCPYHHLYKNCGYSTLLSENKLEKYLINNIANIFDKFESDFVIENKVKKKPATSKKKIESKIKKLKDLYLDDFITKEEYTNDYHDLKKQLEELEKEQDTIKDFSKIKKLLNSNFETIYNSFTQDEKKQFWSSTIKKLTLAKRLEDIQIEFNF